MPKHALPIDPARCPTFLEPLTVLESAVLLEEIRKAIDTVENATDLYVRDGYALMREYEDLLNDARRAFTEKFFAVN